jgi:hypothetical protein
MKKAGSLRSGAAVLHSWMTRHDVAVKPLDSGQEREVAFVRSQRSAWVNLSRSRRVLGAAAVVLLVGLLAGVIAALADGPWLLLGIGAALLGGLAVLPHVLMPERMLRASVRLLTPSAESMRRGDSNRSWPG